MSEGSGDRFQQLEQQYNEYTVYDRHYEKVGKVDDIFVDENDEPEYIGVKMGLLGTKSTLIPIELVRVNDRRKVIEIGADEDAIKNAPTFGDDSDITPEYEDRVHGYFGLQRPASTQSGGYGGYYDSGTSLYTDDQLRREEELRRSVDTDYGERAEPSDRPAASTSYSTSSTSSTSSGGANLDIPLDDGGREEAREDIAAAGAARRTEEPSPAGAQAGGDNRVRVYKRARRA